MYMQQQRDSMMLIFDKGGSGGWVSGNRKRLAESEATVVAMIRVAWGLESCSCRPERWLQHWVSARLQGPPQSYPIVQFLTCSPQPLPSPAV
jgi:hypothetical protein